MTLTVSDLTVRVGTKKLVGPIDFRVEPGAPLVILGETGAGKSLLAQAVMGALPAALAATGAVQLDGERLDTLSRRRREKLWGRRIAMLPQEPWRALDPVMRAGEQIAETHAFVAGRQWDNAHERARGDLSGLGLADAGVCLPGVLSGGMAQRIAFAAATAAGAGVLLADEPTKGLDEARRDDVVRLLGNFARAGGILIVITHDVAVARALGGHAMILRSGAVVEQGPAETVLTAPQSAYGRELVDAAPTNWPQVPELTGARPPVLVGRDLAIGRYGRALLGGLDFTVPEGGRLAVTGPSGLGKTTLLDTIAGLLPPVSGGVERVGRAREKFAVQKLYQDPPAAFPARIPLAVGLKDLEARHRLPPERIAGLLERLSLSPDLLQRRPASVSGGELQRIALARLLALRPALILADEPTSRLDPVTQKQVMGVIADAAAEAEAAVVLVTHQGSMARRWAHQTIALRSGEEGASQPAAQAAGNAGPILSPA
ncbi:ABC transporter ATP-binding protein [Terrihabitans sp. B22-R8]|uniref:ABC transporter ATP-binding protein n=1 Tax=Terrihabitans sp. B22-R8 TaxID=3425128 RepID=UPI00403CDFAA